MNLKAIWNQFSPHERRDIMIYIVGIMFYKFGLEAFNGSITALAVERFNQSGAFGKAGILTGLNQAFQCVGSIMIAPLIKKFPTRSVLSTAIFFFGVLTAVLLICDGATGGRIKSEGKVHYGSFTPYAIFPVFCATGIAYGMVELIRRVIPRDIVGGHVEKLKRMDATVHICYEIAGTAGAIATASFIKFWGNNYSFIITPICFTCAGIIWRFVSPLDYGKAGEDDEAEAMAAKGDGPTGLFSYIASVAHGFIHFGEAVYLGAKIVFSSRKFVWLVPGYSFALVGHRYLENNIANIFAKAVLQDSSFQQIMVGGSNFGELLGALTVFVTAQKIPTPIPFIRLDALLLLIVWYIPYYYPPAHDSSYAWRMAGTFIPISYGWAAGDVSLAAYIQSSLARVENTSKGVSALGAVMSFLYVTYIVIYAIISPLLGTYVDKQKAAGNLYGAIRNISGVHFTILSAIILLSTLIPRGALALNPSLLENERLDSDLEGYKDKGALERKGESSVGGSDGGKKFESDEETSEKPKA